MTDTTIAPADDFAANLRALARQSRALVDTLAQSTLGTQLRLDGPPRPYLWGAPNARDHDALQVKLAAEPQPETETEATPND